MKTINIDGVTYNLVPVEEEPIQKDIVPSILSECESTDNRIVIHTQNEEQADALLALGYLIRLRDETWRRDGNWKPVIEKTYVITNEHGKMVEDDFNHYKEILSFRTAEIRDEFLEKHRGLIEKLLALYV